MQKIQRKSFVLGFVDFMAVAAGVVLSVPFFLVVLAPFIVG